MNLLALPFYSSLNKQDRYRRTCSGEAIFGQLTAANRFPPFQIRRDKTGQLLDCVHVYNIDGTLFKSLIHPDFPYTLQQTQYADYITYYGAAITGLSMPCGFYYLECGGLFSEVFQAANVLSSAVVLEWQNSKPLGGVRYGDGFVQRLLLQTEILEPDYRFEEEGDLNGDEIFVRDLAKLSKLRVLESGGIPEYLVDALNAIPLHDEVGIGTFDELGKLTAKTAWVKGACRGNVSLTFEDQQPVLWRECDEVETATEVDQAGFVPNVAVCNGAPDTRPNWSNTGNIRCKTVEFWQSDPITEQVTRNNCAAGSSTTAVTYELPVGRFESLVSQVDANQQAQAFFNQTKQDYANSNGVCVAPRTIAITATNPQTKQTQVTVTRTDTVGDVTVYLMVQADVDQGPGGPTGTQQFQAIAVIPDGQTTTTRNVGYGGGVLVSFELAEITATNPADYAF